MSNLKNLDSVVLVPSHAEGDGISPMLESLYAQQGVDLGRIAVFVVINAVRGATKDVMDSNALTARTIQEITSSHPDSPLHVEIVDAYTDDSAPDPCNVGIARNIALNAGLGCLRDRDRPVVIMDADTSIAPTYLRDALSAFDRATDLQLATGPTELVAPDALSEKARVLYAIEWRLRRVFESMHDLFTPGASSPHPNLVIGANMVVRARLFDEIGNFSEVAAGEDADFAFRAHRNGARVAYLDYLQARTPARVSTRTGSINNVGGAIARYGNHDGPIADFKVRPREAIFAAQQLFTVLDSFMDEEDMGTWKSKLTSAFSKETGGWDLTKQQLKGLWRMTQELKSEGLVSLQLSEEMAIKVDKYTDSSFPKTPLIEAVQDAMKWCFDQLGSASDNEARFKPANARLWSTPSSAAASALLMEGLSFDEDAGLATAERAAGNSENADRRMDASLDHSLSTLKRTVEMYKYFQPMIQAITGIREAIAALEDPMSESVSQLASIIRTLEMLISYSISAEVTRYNFELSTAPGTFERVSRGETVAASASLGMSDPIQMVTANAVFGRHNGISNQLVALRGNLPSELSDDVDVIIGECLLHYSADHVS